VSPQTAGNDDFAITPSYAGGQQLYNDPPNGRDHNHRSEDGHDIERRSVVNSD
jgi:hypothetical protein